MIAQKFRFHGHASLKFVFAKGRQARSRFFAVKFTPNLRRRHSRLAVVVSKKVFKTAVARNRARRRIYEIARPFLVNSPEIVDVVVSVYSAEIATATHEEINLQLLPLLREAGFRQREK